MTSADIPPLTLYCLFSFTEEGLSSGDEDITFKVEHTVEQEDYEDLDKYLGNSFTFIYICT
jgi:hypothetical protein